MLSDADKRLGRSWLSKQDELREELFERLGRYPISGLQGNVHLEPLRAMSYYVLCLHGCFHFVAFEVASTRTKPPFLTFISCYPGFERPCGARPKERP